MLKRPLYSLFDHLKENSTPLPGLCQEKNEIAIDNVEVVSRKVR
jgi:hypothetical protein